MLDVGEGSRPPGDPPDLSQSYASKVAGGSVGGKQIPDDLLAEEFLETSVRMELPEGDEGEAVVTIDAEVLEVMNGLWKQCMIVKVLGRHVSIAVLLKKLREMWRPKGAMYVVDLPRQFFMVRFELEDEYLEALTGGPWRIFGSYLMVKAWEPEFDPMTDEIVTTPVWIRLSNIPVNFYHKRLLMRLARGLGKPVKVDLTTMNFERGRFARICVDVNLKKPLKGSILINGSRYFVSYEGMTNICPVCENHGDKQRLVEGVVPVKETQRGEEFTMVRRSGRRPETSRKSGDQTDIRGKGNSGNPLQDITNINGVSNVTISNRFVELEEDSIERVGKESESSVVPHKENVSVITQQEKEKSGDQ
ncbi:hypothetical protein CARUB_v10019305mg, partial [Capsella rubella]